MRKFEAFSNLLSRSKCNTLTVCGKAINKFNFGANAQTSCYARLIITIDNDR